MSVIKNAPVRRDKADIKVKEFVSDIKQLSSRYSAAVASSSPSSMAVWEAIKQWDETQVRWDVPIAHTIYVHYQLLPLSLKLSTYKSPPGSLERLFMLCCRRAVTGSLCAAGCKLTAGLAGYETPRLASPALQLNAW